MVKQFQIVAFAIIVIAVTAFNVRTVLDSNRSYDLNITTIAAISGEEGSNGSGEDDLIDRGEIPGGEIVCDTGESGRCYQKTIFRDNRGYCHFNCEASGDRKDYCNAYWMGFIEMCINYSL